MLLRPVDASGDILPVISSSVLLSGPEAVALLVQDRLSLLRGEWWENPENGFFGGREKVFLVLFCQDGGRYGHSEL